ncbi:uncharacterized protein LOC105844931 isoform X2 [Hydra vulgaris]|uniref:Uncharacterized protein LOC105844931 isoform X2 n=1 Tax=Hydra vulgaris TaxID=6087 RepID=A0ABM4C9I6_HYDVU
MAAALFGFFIFYFYLIEAKASTAYSKHSRKSIEKNVATINKSYAQDDCVRNYNSLINVFKLSSSLKKVMLQKNLNCPNTEFLRKKRSTLSWRVPDGLPTGTAISFCSSPTCCTPKKSLNPDGGFFNLCRECLHQIMFPSRYTPRLLHFVTCQDIDFTESCLSGEGSCTTNMVANSVLDTYTNQQLTFVFGGSCSCEIRRDSVFTPFI